MMNQLRLQEPVEREPGESIEDPRLPIRCNCLWTDWRWSSWWERAISDRQCGGPALNSADCRPTPWELILSPRRKRVGLRINLTVLPSVAKAMRRPITTTGLKASMNKWKKIKIFLWDPWDFPFPLITASHHRTAPHRTAPHEPFMQCGTRWSGTRRPSSTALRREYFHGTASHNGLLCPPGTRCGGYMYSVQSSVLALTAMNTSKFGGSSHSSVIVTDEEMYVCPYSTGWLKHHHFLRTNSTCGEGNITREATVVSATATCNCYCWNCYCC